MSAKSCSCAHASYLVEIDASGAAVLSFVLEQYPPDLTAAFGHRCFCLRMLLPAVCGVHLPRVQRVLDLSHHHCLLQHHSQNWAGQKPTQQAAHDTKLDQAAPQCAWCTSFSWWCCCLQYVECIYLVFRGYWIFPIIIAFFSIMAKIGLISVLRSKQIMMHSLISQRRIVPFVHKGWVQAIPCFKLVPGDVVVLQRGKATCDMVLLRGSCLVEESMLSGEVST